MVRQAATAKINAPCAVATIERMGNVVLANVTSPIANLATVALVITVVLFMLERRRLRWERDERVFREVNDSYLAYLQLVLENPALSAFEYEGTDERARRELALWELLFTVTERAFVLYRASDARKARPDSFRARQWAGWREWCRRWAEREDFRLAWAELRGSAENDEAFGTFVDGLIAEAELTRQRPRDPTP
jgi:hypothetical protein